MITDELISKIYDFLPRWEELAHHLGVDPLVYADIKKIQRGISVSLQNSGFLTKWKAAKQGDATCRRLIEALEELGEAESAARVRELVS